MNNTEFAELLLRVENGIKEKGFYTCEGNEKSARRIQKKLPIAVVYEMKEQELYAVGDVKYTQWLITFKPCETKRFVIEVINGKPIMTSEGFNLNELFGVVSLAQQEIIAELRGGKQTLITIK